jgi:hypothetical protein
MVEGDRGTCAIVATRSFCYWPQLLVYSGVKKSGKLSLPTSTGCLPNVGTRYFFLSPLPLVCYLEIVLPLHAGPLFSKNFLSASASPLFRCRYFFCSALAALPLVRYSATAIFSIVHTFNVVFFFLE